MGGGFVTAFSSLFTLMGCGSVLLFLRVVECPFYFLFGTVFFENGVRMVCRLLVFAFLYTIDI